MRNALTAIAFLSGLALASGIYFGLKIDIDKLLGLIGNKDNNFQYAGKIILEENFDKEAKSKTAGNKEEKTQITPTKKSKKKIEQKVAVLAKDLNKNSSQVNNSNYSSSVSIQAAAKAVITTATINVAAEGNEPINQSSVAETLSAQTENNSLQQEVNVSINHILISEVMVGIDGNSAYEFIELYNPTASAIDLTNWTIKKISSTGSESSLLVALRLEGKIIGAGKYFLAANEGGYSGQVAADVFWATSNTLAYSNNAIILYNGNSEKVEEISWQEIPKGQSFVRQSWDSSQFILSSPTPQNSDY
ncbi:hypothetical protein A2999_01135 [Candidatus Wolfebacteria bacterium RIFCSPLOWO2_01_FULL_38_11]|uniref:Collagen adhesion protein n=2 Tax=Candidatus Wolfeibacteriota TaxID=1752735 RepID=A0A0G0G9F6_9BACT|nr:MAG: Collagen adhesion protein [Candidatus Wolfebacteria bacterium GW2011_GWC1_37_10]OGM91125.1 MAG: hypothetical protein A2999_01135 [Candidatus Wolfebacteria bacterium RIFCSPLOWO2_01_FULL_38_11]